MSAAVASRRSFHTQYLKRAVKDFYALDEVMRVVLYGSFIRGGYTSQSDIDVGVFVADGSDILLLSRKLWKISSRYPTDIQPQVFHVQELRYPIGIVEEITAYGVDAAEYFSMPSCKYRSIGWDVAL